MGLKDSISNLFGSKAATGLQSGLSIGKCPYESEILSYSEGTLLSGHRSQMERHFASCDRCRGILAFLAEFDKEPLDAPAPLPEDIIKKQTARIIAYMANDDRQSRDKTAAEPEPVLVRPKGFFVSYPQLAAVAMVICAVLASGIYYLTRGQKPEAAAMEQLADAMKEERRSVARISGGFDYSPLTAITRGSGDTEASDSDDLQLKRSLNKLKSAERGDAPAPERLALARTHLAFDKHEHSIKAFEILTRLSSENAGSPEILNDLGVAQLQLRKYDEAIVSFTRALENRSYYEEALFNRAIAEKQGNRTEEAMRDLSEFINRSSDARWKQEAQEMLNSLIPSRNP